jgi:hypothetical protein
MLETHAAGARTAASPRDGVSDSLRRITLAVSAASLLGGLVVTALEPRYGLFATAVILGWTQLVGL